MLEAWRIRMSKKIVLIDGNSILNRAFYGVPILTNEKGIHTNAIFGFLNILLKILEEEKAEYLTVAFDVRQPTFRHEMYKEYKGTRKPTPEELLEQVPIVKEVLKAMQIKTIEKAGYEADDILGTLAITCVKEGLEVSLISGDRDLLQLASDKIKIRIPKTKQGKTEVEDYYTQDVIDKYGVTPIQIIDLKGLMGDASDNIPGVPSIGEKTAVKILKAFETVENAYAHIEEITPNRAKEALRQHYDLALLSKKLATIKLDCELEFQLEDAILKEYYTEEAYTIFKELEFKNFLKRFEKHENQGMEDEIEKINKEYRVIKTKKQAEEVFQTLEKIKGHIGCQIFQKTKEEIAHPISNNGQYSFFSIGEAEKQDTIIGVSIAYQIEKEATKCFYIPTSEELTGCELVENINRCIQKGIKVSVIELKSMLNLLEVGELITETDDFSKVTCFDCSVAAYLLNPLKETYYYDNIASDYLEITIPSYAELFSKKSMEEIRNTKEFTKYGCYMAYIAYKAYHVLLEQLKQTNMEYLYYQIELPLVKTLYDMEERGVHVNKEELNCYGEQLEERIVALEKEIYNLVGETFNINSPKQLGVILFEKLELPFGKKTKTGYSTSADILEKLKSEHPAVEKILEYRQLTKLKSTYADGLANYIEEDGRIHSKFNQTITATGRISSTEPNLQNIPIRMELGRKIRKVFIPKEGYIFLDADYSQIELRVLAHMSGDKRLIAAYREAQDIHKITASEVFHTPIDEVTELQRRNAKAVNFGIVYGISSFGLGQGLNIGKKEAEEYITKYFETYPRVKEFLDELVVNAKKNGYVDSLFHRRRPVPELSSSNFMQRSFGERIAMNTPIQGTAADIIKIAMIRVNNRLLKEKLKSQLILQVHDELLVETHESEIEKVKQILQEEMFGAAELQVPLEVSVDQGKNWYEAH